MPGSPSAGGSLKFCIILSSQGMKYLDGNFTISPNLRWPLRFLSFRQLFHVMMEPSKIWALSLSGVMSELVNLLEGKGSMVLPLIRPIMTQTWATYPLNFSIKSLATRSVQPTFKFNLIKITQFSTFYITGLIISLKFLVKMFKDVSGQLIYHQVLFEEFFVDFQPLG